MLNNEQKEKRVYVGVVVSDKMDKTIVVSFERAFSHDSFTKTMRKNKKYKVHDENEQAQVGDIVEFYEGRPGSKTKYMYLLRVVKTSGLDAGIAE